MGKTKTKNPRNDLVARVREQIFHENASEANPLSEQGLADHFGASRAPIRDALGVLESEGLLVRRKGKGLYLRRPAFSEIVDIYDTRAAIEGFAVRQVCDRWQPESLALLDEMAKKFTQFRDNGQHEKATEVNLKFHNYIIELSGNQLMQRILSRFHMIQRSFTVTTKLKVPLMTKTPYPHEALIELLRERDADACERFLRSHILHAKQIAVDWAVRNMPT